MAKIAYATDTSSVDAEIRERRGGELRPLDRMLLHSPPVALGWNALLGAVRTRTDLRGDLRELVVLRVAILNDCAYEWTAHEPVALREGLSPASIDALRADDAAARLSGDEALVCAFTDQVTRSIRVDDELFAELVSRFGEQGAVELSATAAAYNMVSRFLVATGVSDDAKKEVATHG